MTKWLLLQECKAGSICEKSIDTNDLKTEIEKHTMTSMDAEKVF